MTKFGVALDNECDPYGWMYTSHAKAFPEYVGGIVVNWRIHVSRTHKLSWKSVPRKSSTRSVNLTHPKMKLGKGRTMRDCQLIEGCLETIKHDNRIYVSSTYSPTFTVGNPPKFLVGNKVPSKFDVILEANSLQRKNKK
jgi:hypothetical protein